MPPPCTACRRINGMRDSKAADTIGTLSRGYRQRVGVAQAILHSPRLLILDEPTNGLDPTQVQHMRDLIRTLAHNATVIISTHILQEVQAICDRVIIVRKQALDLLSAVAGVNGVERVIGQGAGHRYALELADGDALDEAAPTIASQIAQAGWKLYALQPETRDLETVFGEISAQQGR